MSPGSAEALPGDADMALDDAGALAALVRHRGWWPAIVLGAWRGAVTVAALVVAQMRRVPLRFRYHVRGHSAGASVAPMHRCGWPPAVAIALWWRRRAGGGARAPIRRRTLLRDVGAFPSAEGGWGAHLAPPARRGHRARSWLPWRWWRVCANRALWASARRQAWGAQWAPLLVAVVARRHCCVAVACRCDLAGGRGACVPAQCRALMRDVGALPRWEGRRGCS
jgi:hypothetical protein